jgi:hypothetical protein
MLIVTDLEFDLAERPAAEFRAAVEDAVRAKLTSLRMGRRLRLVSATSFPLADGQFRRVLCRVEVADHCQLPTDN